MLECFLNSIKRYRENPSSKIQVERFSNELLKELQISVSDDTRISERSNLHLFREGELFFRNSTPKTLKDVNKLAKNEKFTYRIHGHHNNNRTLKYMKDFLELSLKIQSHANLYVTKKDSQTLAKHKDRYTVLVLQLKGRKRWFFDKTEFTTSPGEYFILPVGHPHYAIAENNEDSYHVSFGILLPSIYQLLHHCALSQDQILDFNPDKSSDFLDISKEFINSLIENPILLKQGVKNFEKVLSSLRLNPETNNEAYTKPNLNENIELDLSKIASVDFDSVKGNHLRITLLNKIIHIYDSNKISIFFEIFYKSINNIKYFSPNFPISASLEVLALLNKHEVLK